MRLKIVFIALFLMSLIFSSIVLFQGEISGENQPVIAEKKGSTTIVIDPGHGGFDGGAVAKDGTVEKDINLKIALALKDILEEYPIDVVMTRTTDVALDDSDGSIRNRKQQDLRNRKELIKKSNADLTISIHLNSYPDDASVYGAQVFYPKDEQKRTNVAGYTYLSKDYAESVQKSIEINVSDGRERAAMAKGDVLLLKEPESPIILVECGFLSNEDELNRLKTAEYQELMARSIWDGINAYLSIEKEEKMQIIHSANKQ